MEIKGIDDIVLWTYTKDNVLNADPDNGGFVYNGNQGKVFDPITGEELKGLFKVDMASSKGATQANITGLAPSVTRVYGSNQVAEVEVGNEQPSIVLGANDIPHIIYDILSGLTKDKFGGYARKGRPNPTSGGLVAHSHNDNYNIDLYFAFPLGIYVPGEINMGTNAENAVVVHDSLTLNAQARPSDLLLYEKFYSNEKDFDYAKMLKYLTGQITTDSTAGNKNPTDANGNPITPGSGNNSEPSNSGSESNSNSAS